MKNVLFRKNKNFFRFEWLYERRMAFLLSGLLPQEQAHPLPEYASMLINADFSRRAGVQPVDYEWVASPRQGVERVMLDRVGAEKARATSIVRYAAGTTFPPHPHPGGEEILVLSGVFSDEAGDYPAGSYLRNPPGTSHRPFSREGALIFVKLWQMPSHESRSVRVDTRDPSQWQTLNGRERCLLFANETEQVSLERLKPDDPLFKAPVDGAAMLVLQGALREGSKAFLSGAWLRLPPGEYPEFAAGEQDVTLYLKSGEPGKPDATTGGLDA